MLTYVDKMSTALSKFIEENKPTVKKIGKIIFIVGLVILGIDVISMIMYFCCFGIPG